MSSIASYLRQLREQHGWDIQGVAQRAGLPQPLVAEHELGQTAPSLQQRRSYATAYAFTDVFEFDEGWRAQTIVTSQGDASGGIPVINKAPAGEPADYEECYPNSGIGYEYIDRTPGLEGQNLFAFVVVGNSMEQEFLEGDYVICAPVPAEQIDEGEAVFVRFGPERDHRCTFKRAFSVDHYTLELRPNNPRYEPLVVPKEHIVRLAPVVEWRRKTKRKAMRREMFLD